MAKILVVEDDPMLQRIYASVLSKEGHQVEVASDGKEGLRSANANEPDVILLDMRMPNMTGLEFLRAYDVITKHPKVRVIVFTNTEQPLWVKEAMALGARKYMTKHSFSPKAMVQLINDTLASPGSS